MLKLLRLSKTENLLLQRLKPVQCIVGQPCNVHTLQGTLVESAGIYTINTVEKLTKHKKAERTLWIGLQLSLVRTFQRGLSDWASDSDTEDEMAENRFCCDYAKRGQASCKKCKQKIEKGVFRIAKVVTNPFSDEGGDMKQWYHPACIFETFQRARATTKIIEKIEDIEGHEVIKDEEKEILEKLIKDLDSKLSPAKKKAMKQAKIDFTNLKTPEKKDATNGNIKHADDDDEKPSTSGYSGASFSSKEAEKDNSFRQFRCLCAEIAEEASYNGKTAIVHKFITKGSSGDGFAGSLYLIMKLLLPGFVKRVYNINNKQLIKLYSQAFGEDQDEMSDHFDQGGDVADTIKEFFEKSTKLPPQKKSTLSLQEVDAFLDELTLYTREEDQQRALTKIAKKCTANDLKMVVRLVKHDLRINAGAKHILDGLDEHAYPAFQASRNLKDVVDRVMANKAENGRKPGMSKKLSIKASLMTPVLPMLAEACKSVASAMKKCPNGMYAEIKYDGERVQVHKQGDKFHYYSRSLKPVLPHKVSHFKDFIPKAFEGGNDLILDSEVLLIDTNTSKPLPFGSLGVHKKAAFKDANVCLFVFDCLHYNGENLMNRPIKERRKFLRDNMKEIPNRIMFSEMKFINKAEDLKKEMMKVFKEGLEGLVLKDINSIYEPGKRHWLKVKKDYLNEGAMADTADLVVLGAYYGSGNKGGLMSVFLMGCWDPKRQKWCTVTKCGNGMDDKKLDQLQKELDMVKIGKNQAKVPDWLDVKKAVVPDFVCADPKKSQVWEITGAEFSKAEVHTAAGISIRFPRVTKFRDDKGWREATNLDELKHLFKTSKETSDLGESSLMGGKSPVKNTPKKRKHEDDDDDDDDDDNSNNHYGNPSPTKQIMLTPSKTSPAKRNNDVTPTKKLKTSDDGNNKPSCKYGAECYQTNPQHLEQFSHPSNRKIKSPIKSKILLDIFKGLKFSLSNSVEKLKDLKRYIIAYDGDVVPEYDSSQATHVVVGKNEKVENPASNVVSEDWVWGCVKERKLLPVKDC
ncbi:DNA ligase 3 [Lingula anatina]|uniref:DNA ligase n=1 Tax=Lingula anatina TaxID=7574 RepID=A0A1S3I5L9_LINAN|nr:DNA ligase 3 [Lingula anatina]|eukprot:XP_013393552.1 DNA ligase 3 [Lingula anatina]